MKASVFASLFSLPGRAGAPDNPDTPGAPEYVRTILAGAGARVERIVSFGHVTPAGQWYDQDEDEWCAVLKGSAVLAFADGRRAELSRGMSIFLPARCRHRVEATSSPCVWLAVFGKRLAMTADPGEGRTERGAS